MPQTRGNSGDTTARRADAEQRGDGSQSPQTDGERAANPSGTRARVSQWLAASAVRLAVGFVGLVLLLYALGQAVGVPLLELTADVLSTQTGRWLVVAAFAAALIGLAQRGLPTS